MPRKKQNKKIEYIRSEENLKYLSRSFYYGTLRDYEWISGGLVLIMDVFSSSAWHGCKSVIRVYVPSDLENEIVDYLECGSNYLLITAPYKVRGATGYNYRTDLLLAIFKPINE